MMMGIFLIKDFLSYYHKLIEVNKKGIRFLLTKNKSLYKIKMWRKVYFKIAKRRTLKIKYLV